MGGRSFQAERAALDAFRRHLQRALACVTSAIVMVRPGNVALSQHPAPLGYDRAVSLSLELFVVTEPMPDARRRQVRIVGYSYAVHDRAGQELLTYQWHPVGRSPVVRPHLHLGSRLLRPELAPPFGRTHWPTERVTLTAVLRAAIEDLGVEPLRDDWQERLTVAETVLAASLG